MYSVQVYQLDTPNTVITVFGFSVCQPIYFKVNVVFKFLLLLFVCFFVCFDSRLCVWITSKLSFPFTQNMRETLEVQYPGLWLLKSVKEYARFTGDQIQLEIPSALPGWNVMPDKSPPIVSYTVRM